jgi:hypothetical protein
MRVMFVGSVWEYRKAEKMLNAKCLHVNEATCKKLINCTKHVELRNIGNFVWDKKNADGEKEIKKIAQEMGKCTRADRLETTEFQVHDTDH